MEHLLFIAIVLALIEFREFKQNKRYKEIKQQIDALADNVAAQITANACGTAVQLESLRNEIAPLAEFLTKAQTDLATIVEEYEVNGVPLGYQRGNKQHFDMVEGL